MIKKLMVANWKMHKNGKECNEFLRHFLQKYSGKREAWISPQSLFIKLVINSPLKAGLQNCSDQVQGAYTGEVSPRTFKEMGGHFVILGHSERRILFKETSGQINLKIKAALKEGLVVIYCIGETLSERDAQLTFSIVENQLHQGLSDLPEAHSKNLIIAYEPVWAIGTGKSASAKQAQEVHSFIRLKLKNKFPDFGDQIKILYGGSVKPENVEELMGQPDIDGALVGGASLKHGDFLALCADK
jgi:triosephosphate isomerase (TIM)